MWKDIILSIGTVVGEAIYLNHLDEQKSSRYHSKLETILEKLLNDFADTSLDCGDFHKLVNSSGFCHHVRMFFYTMYYDRTTTTTYQSCLADYIHTAVPKLNILDVSEFVQSLSILYETHLYSTIRDNPAIDALFQLLVKTNGDAYRKILSNQELILKYLRSQVTEPILIEDATINGYHEVCQKEYGIIRFTGIAGAENRQAQKLNDYYIQNTFSFYLPIHSPYRNDDSQKAEFDLENIFDFGNKVVILGGAGFGKTTTLNYIYCNYEDLFQGCALKIKIDLKEYANDIWKDKRDILWCIARDFFKKTKRSNYSFEELQTLLSGLLGNGQCIVIFDALDEITKLSMRNKVRDAIHNFCEIYFLNRFIISSREAGYLRNQFDGSFLHIKINEFDEEQIKQYSYNWFSNNYQDGNFEEFWENFSTEVNRARCERLVQNPIILILALIIFDIEKNLPNKRVEFYKKCIDTFLSVREDRKGARELSKNAKNILADDSVVPQIAFHKFSCAKENPQYRFDMQELRNAVFTAIDVMDPINWNSAVDEYSSYLIERTELIQEVDEDVLNFAHKTFFEYFLAVYYVKEFELKALITLLKKWIGDSNYDELARLIIEVIIQANNANQHHKIIDCLFTIVEQGDSTRRDSIGFSTFVILADLYSHNMLLPKYHARYYLYILYHPYVVRTVEQMRRFDKTRYGKVAYDSGILASMYCDAATDPERIVKLLDAANYLDNDFRKQIVSNLQDKKHIQMIRLLRLTPWERKWRPSSLPVLEYFTTSEGLDSTRTYPQIYLSVLSMMAQAHRFNEIERMTSVSFAPNEYVWHYIRPSVLYELIDQSIRSCASLTAMLIVLIDCGYQGTNKLFCYLLNQEMARYSKHTDRTIMLARWLLHILNETSSYDQFKSILVSKELYESKFDDVLRRLYSDYLTREKDLEKGHLKKIVKKLPSEGMLFPIEGLDFKQLSIPL